jgi:hypothetical protein
MRCSQSISADKMKLFMALEPISVFRGLKQFTKSLQQLLAVVLRWESVPPFS